MGKKRGPRWYNHAYAKTKAYSGPIETLPWWELYCAAAAWVAGQDRDVVELGCGVGHLASLLASLSQRRLGSYVGLDFSSVAIEQAAARVPDRRFNFLRRDLDTVRLRFAAGRAIVGSELLEHLEFDRELVAKLPAASPVWVSVARFDARSHVRFFEDTKAVVERYGELLGELEVTELERFIILTSAIPRRGRSGRKQAE